MSKPITFVLDANVFIQAARQYYAFDLAPSFWQSLIHFGQLGRLMSIDRISEELKKGMDELADWAQSSFGNAFAPTDSEDITQSYSEIMNWVNNQKQFSDAAKADFAQGADGWLIAYARVNGYTIVTQEQMASALSHKVKIPNVCHAFNVPYVDTFSMLRSLGIRFN